ncbi:MAG: putative Zn-dependent protease, partial [Candidatus Paceibacteria bacterium]
RSEPAAIFAAKITWGRKRKRLMASIRGMMSFQRQAQWLCFGLLLVCVLGLVSQPAAAMSEEDEVALGAKEHQKVLGQYGVYRDKALQTYIDRVGQRIAAKSSRPTLAFTFTVLNDDMINAFALPGGYIYITRGMLLHMNSESELAAVLGHEVAHVTEKHGLRNQSTGKLLGGVTIVASILTQVPGVYDLGGMLGDVLMKGYSRGFELEADAVGASYMAKAGYAPEAMLRTIEILKDKDRVEYNQARLEKRAPRVYHGILSSHPDNDTRYAEAIIESNRLVVDGDEFVGADEFLEKLNGLTIGPTRKTGIVRKNRFYHPKLGIKLSFPVNWRIEYTSQGVQALSMVGDAVFAIGTERIRDGVVGREFLEKQLGLNLREGRDVTISRLPGFLGIAERADSPYGTRPVRVAVLFDQRRRLAYVMTGSGQYDLAKVANDKDFIGTIFSFDLMDREDRQKIRDPKLQVVRAEQGTTMEALAAESPITNYALDKLRVINGLYPDGQPVPGQLIKVIE